MLVIIKGGVAGMVQGWTTLGSESMSLTVCVFMTRTQNFLQWRDNLCLLGVHKCRNFRKKSKKGKLELILTKIKSY